MSEYLVDNFGRPIHYLRLAVTDRCNMRCFYCMPHEGIRFARQHALLSFDEMERLVRVLGDLGISKIRLTGGEPFVRKGILPFLDRLAGMELMQAIAITTNGVLTSKYLDRLDDWRVGGVNLSLDSLDPDRFFAITRRKVYDEVMTTLHGLLAREVKLKINTVVLENQNIDDLIPLAELTRQHNLDMRFLEEMPFNASREKHRRLTWDHLRILEHLRETWPNLEKVKDPMYSTASHYRVPGFKGRIGIIAAFSRTFCGTCNRIRITAEGQLKTCLYDGGVLDVRAMLRAGASNDMLTKAFLTQIGNRARDGFEAEARRVQLDVFESMATIGG